MFLLSTTLLLCLSPLTVFTHGQHSKLDPITPIRQQPPSFSKFQQNPKFIQRTHEESRFWETDFLEEPELLLENQRFSRDHTLDRAVPSIDECPSSEQVTYTAAVLEYEPYSDWEEAVVGGNILQENVIRISEFAETAKSLGADILVVPEYGVQGLQMRTNDTVSFQSLTQIVPDPALGVVPCTDPTDPGNYEAVRQLSCTALQHQMYLVADLAEQAPCSSPDCSAEGLEYHNTQVVFDRTGAVIARYRKQNLYLEPQFSPGDSNDTLALFDTDFGVRFSLQICFDITFEHPGFNNVKTAGVRDVVMSTAWVDEVPFILAVNVQNAWSRGMGSNLMVSGYHWPEHTKLGSGIYLGYSDLSNAYTYDADSGDVLVVAQVKTCRTVPATRETNNVIDEPRIVQFPKANSPSASGVRRRHAFLHEDLSVYNRTVLATTQPGEPSTETLCHADGLCCRLTYELSNSNLTYQMLAFSGVLKKGGDVYQIYSQVCAVVWCIGEDHRTCAAVDVSVPEEDVFGPFTLEGDYSVDAVFPVAMSRKMTLVSNKLTPMTMAGSTYRMTASEGIQSLMSAAVFGRWYDRDPPRTM